MRTRWSLVGWVAASAGLSVVGACSTAPKDSVVGSGTVELLVDGVPDPVVTAFEFDVHSGPSGENPSGQVSLDAFFSDAAVTCLEVRTIPLLAGSGEAITDALNHSFDEATMNLMTDDGLVTLQASDGDVEGLQDFISARTQSDRSPSDCSRLAFGSENLRGFVESGEIDFVNADPPPATPE